MIFLLNCYIFVPLRQNSRKWSRAITINMAYFDYSSLNAEKEPSVILAFYNGEKYEIFKDLCFGDMLVFFDDLAGACGRSRSKIGLCFGGT